MPDDVKARSSTSHRYPLSTNPDPNTGTPVRDKPNTWGRSRARPHGCPGGCWGSRAHRYSCTHRYPCANSHTSSQAESEELRALLAASPAELKVYTSDDRLPIWYMGDAVGWFVTHLAQ